MTLVSGQSLTHYEILGPLGAGGMGEVYRARDTRLDREVAIKVLPEELADDPDRFLRFEREAKTLASLNHPNVAGIHGVDTEGDIYFLALELVPGEDLAARLSRGALPVDEALDIGRQIAEGLEAAHEAGVVHRDLKPANVRVTPDGVVKILDFGLAKPIRPEAGDGGTSTAESDSFLMTAEGMVLGTPTYMSPEQARGKPVDRRTDIWAFGCVLYECLTGQRAFTGETFTDVVAAIAVQEPSWSRLPALPGHVRRLLRRCLTKDPRQRLRDVGEARVWLAGWEEEDGGESRLLQGGARPHSWVVALGVGLLVVLALWAGGFLRTPATGTTSPTHFTLDHPLADRGTWGGNLLAISRDADTIAYVSVAGDSRLHLRSMGEFEARPVPGTEGATAPCFSPDGAVVAYWTDGKLMKAPVTGGTPSLLATTSRLHEACWGTDDRIIAVELGSLVGIDVRTGERRAMLTDDSTFVDSPSVLPDGVTVLLDRESELCAALADGTWRALGQPGLNPNWSGTGHVVFQALDETIWSAPFDPDRIEITGEAVQLVDRPVLDFDVASDGTLVYVPGLGRAMELVWVDRAGEATPLGFESGHYLVPRLAPGDDRVAVSLRESTGGTDLWVLELARGGRTRITTDGDWNLWPVWTHAATHLAYMGGAYLWTRASDGTGEARRLMEGDGRYEVPISWSEDDQALAFYDYGQNGDIRIWYDDGGPREFLVTPSDERSPHFSPDGRWIAYVSDTSGTNEVYVRPHVRGQAPDSRFVVSTGGGGEPRWSRDGGELFYRRDTQTFAVSFGTGTAPEIGVPRLLFDRPYLTNPIGRSNPNYDVAADGRFLMIRVSESAVTSGGVVHVSRGLAELVGR